MYPFKLIIPIGSIFKPNLVYTLPILVNGTRKTRNKLLLLQGKKKKTLCVLYKISSLVHLNNVQIIAQLFSGEGKKFLFRVPHDDILELIFS